MSQSTFTISLDFELHWGAFEKWDQQKFRQYFLNTRTVIPEVLASFKSYQIHATWATVGMLFHGSRDSLVRAFPLEKPSYDKQNLSAYHYIDSIGVGESEQSDPLHYAPTLIKEIIETPGQEVGSHTFAHYYCNEPGQKISQFKADLKAAQLSAAPYERKLRSLVFPRNQFNEEYLKACYEEGFVAVRDNPRDWFWNIQSTQRESSWKRLNRGMDAYLTVGKNNTYKLESLDWRAGLPVCIPASRLLRPYRSNELFLNSLKISRIKSEMEKAARQGDVYHLWWHPHNFGHYPKESMEGLKKILDHFAYCREKYRMKSLSMGEVADLVIEHRKDILQMLRHKGE